MKVPSKKALREKLLESLFDPRDPGRFGVIMDGADRSYLVARASEILRDPRIQSDERIRDAISLLAYARFLQ